MFLQDLVEFIASDASVNLLATGGIVFDHLAVNFDANKNWIVFNYFNDGNESSFGTKNALENYVLDVQIISKNVTSIDDISNALTTHLTTYPNSWGIDATISDDNLDWSSEKEVYFKTIKYNILY